MSELLFENPLLIGLVGVACTLVALVMWIKGGFRPALYTAIGLVIITLLLLLLNISTRTDREQIDQVLHEVATAVEQNDLPKVITYIHPSAVPGLERAKSELPSYRFTEARITGIKSIEVKPHTEPPSAIAEFNVAVSLSGGGDQLNGIRRFVRAYFMKRDGRWLVHNYDHFEPTAGFRQTLPSGESD